MKTGHSVPLVVSKTWTIPVIPTFADTTGSVSIEVGVVLDGSEISGPAPISAITNAYTIAVFDDCGGHLNVHQGYHYHAATGCTEVGTQDDGHSSLLGYALDGSRQYCYDRFFPECVLTFGVNKYCCMGSL